MYLDLDDLWTAATAAEAPMVHIQYSLRMTGTSIPTIESEVLLTVPLPDDRVLAARIFIERADALADRHRLYAAMTARARRIVDLLSTEAVHTGLIVQPGITLVPGLLDDLKKTDCATGNRWQITETERGDPPAR